MTVIIMYRPPQPSVEGSEVGSAVPSPVPQSEEGSMEVQVAASSGESKSPAQRKQRKKWSFKRTKSQEEGAEGELSCDDLSLHQ